MAKKLNLKNISVFVSSCKYPEVKLLNHVIVLFLTFKETSIRFSIVDAPIYALTTVHKGSLFSTSLPALVISCPFDNSHSN